MRLTEQISSQPGTKQKLETANERKNIGQRFNVIHGLIAADAP